MFSFARSLIQRFLLLSAVLLTLAVVGVDVAIADQKSELKAIERKLGKLSDTIGKDTQKRQAKQQSLEDIEKQIAERSARQRISGQKVGELNTRIAELNQDTAKTQATYDQSLENFAQLVRSTYQMGRQHRTKLLLSQQDPAMISRSAKYYEYIADSREQQLTDLFANRQSLDGLTAELEAKNASLSRVQAQLDKDQAYLNQLKKNREGTIAKLDKTIGDQQQTLDTLKARQKRLKSVLDQIAKAKARKQALAKQREKEREQKRQQQLAKKKSPQPPNSQASRSPGSISKLKSRVIRGTGSLPMPTKAKVLARFGQKRADTGIPWTGMMLAAQAGDAVKAIKAGEVVYADWLKGYGLLLIIDHGDSLMSLYGHNSALLNHVGDQVNQSDTVARVGDTAGLRNAALYFEIRHNGEPEDPLKWCRG